MKKEFTYIKVESSEGICSIFFNRPEKLNSLIPKMQSEITEALKHAERDQDIRVIIMSGIGRAFIAGADISLMADQNSFQYREYATWYHEVREQMLGLSKPIIGAVNGFAFGGGAVIAFSTDLIVAAEGAKFGQQEINVGHIKGASYLPRVVGRFRAAQIVMLGETIKAQEAYLMGLVNWVVPNDLLMNKANEIAKKLIEKSPKALMMAKQVLRMQSESPESVADFYELEANSLCFGTPEQIESMQAFVGKRNPDFKKLK